MTTLCVVRKTSTDTHSSFAVLVCLESGPLRGQLNGLHDDITTTKEKKCSCIPLKIKIKENKDVLALRS